MGRFSICLAGLLLFAGIGQARAQRESVRVNENYWYNSTAARNLEASHEMLVTPLLADVQLQECGRQVFGEDRFYYVDVDATDAWKAQTIDQLKRQALFDFTKEYKADVIVGALISAQTVDEDHDGQVDRERSRYKVRITISGYPANYVNFRNAKATDGWIKDQLLLKRDSKQNSAVTDSQSGSVTQGRKTVVLTD